MITQGYGGRDQNGSIINKAILMIFFKRWVQSMNVFVLKLWPIASDQSWEGTSKYDYFCERYLGYFHQLVKYQEQLFKLINLITLTFYHYCLLYSTLLFSFDLRLVPTAHTEKKDLNLKYLIWPENSK